MSGAPKTTGHRYFHLRRKTYTFGPENLWFESVARPRRRLIITKWFLCVLTVGGNRNDGAMKKHQAEVSASVDPLRRLLTARETTTSTGLQGQVSVKEKKKKRALRVKNIQFLIWTWKWDVVAKSALDVDSELNEVASGPLVVMWFGSTCFLFTYSAHLCLVIEASSIVLLEMNHLNSFWMNYHQIWLL